MQAHRDMVGAKSAYLNAMFSIGMMEAASGRVRVRDCSEASFRAAVVYMYTGVLEADMRSSCQDLTAADLTTAKYWDHVCKYVQTYATMDVGDVDVRELWRLADMYAIDGLKTFLARNLTSSNVLGALEYGLFTQDLELVQYCVDAMQVKRVCLACVGGNDLAGISMDVVEIIVEVCSDGDAHQFDHHARSLRHRRASGNNFGVKSGNDYDFGAKSGKDTRSRAGHVQEDNFGSEHPSESIAPHHTHKASGKQNFLQRVCRRMKKNKSGSPVDPMHVLTLMHRWWQDNGHVHTDHVTTSLAHEKIPYQAQVAANEGHLATLCARDENVNQIFACENQTHASQQVMMRAIAERIGFANIPTPVLRNAMNTSWMVDSGHVAEVMQVRQRGGRGWGRLCAFSEEPSIPGAGSVTSGVCVCIHVCICGRLVHVEADVVVGRVRAFTTEEHACVFKRSLYVGVVFEK